MDKALNTIQRVAPPPQNCREIWLAGGCFWGSEEYLSRVRGVVSTAVGYANGSVPDPTYELVCTGNTGYAEAVHVVYDPAALPLARLLEIYFESVDPSAVNRQGHDVGAQYRTGIYYLDEADRPAIDGALQKLAATLSAPVAIEAKPLESFWLAEEYHQKYLKKNPNGYCHIPAYMFSRAEKANEQ